MDDAIICLDDRPHTLPVLVVVGDDQTHQRRTARQVPRQVAHPTQARAAQRVVEPVRSNPAVVRQTESEIAVAFEVRWV